MWAEQSTHTLVWDPLGTGNPNDEISIQFDPNPASGLADEQKTRHQLRAAGLGATWIRQHLMRRANVVILAIGPDHPLTATERAKLVACLHR
jgi:hypothetical protein